MCEPTARAPAADGGTLFIESVSVRAAGVEGGGNVTVVELAVFHEGREFAEGAIFHAAQTGRAANASYWLAGGRRRVLPCTVRLPPQLMPDVTLLSCEAPGLDIPVPRPGAAPWELQLRWNYSRGGEGDGDDDGSSGSGGVTYGARIWMCAAAVPFMYACPQAGQVAQPRRVPRLGVCVSSMSNKHGTLTPKLVVDFIEYYRLLGVHHIAIHMRPDAAASVGAALTAAYAADAPHFVFEAIPSGYVTADPANLDRWPYYDQAGTLTSCVGHMRGQVSWLGMLDIDEWLVDGNGTVTTPLTTMLTAWGCGAMTEDGAPRVHATACNRSTTPPGAARLSCVHMQRDAVAAPFVPGGEYPGGATALQYFRDALLATPNNLLSPKAWCDPDAIAATWVHHAVAIPGATAVIVPEVNATFRHFTSYFNAREQSGAFPRSADAAFAAQLAAASAARLAHPACVTATSTATAAMAAAAASAAAAAMTTDDV